MLGPFFFQLAKRMSRGNGLSLAKAMTARVQKLLREKPHRPPVEYWQEALLARPGWQELRENFYEFKGTGDRFEFNVRHSPKQWLARITEIEVKPLSRGMLPEAQGVLVQEAVEAATAWWDHHGINL